MMDDQISRTILENFDVSTVENSQNEINKMNAPGVLRGMEGGSLHFITVPARDQEFIDHSFLSPEYIATHIANGFIIDLMNNQDGSDSQQPQQFVNESIPNDLVFQNEDQDRKLTATLLQLVNKQQCPTTVNKNNGNEAQVIVSNKDLATITPVNEATKTNSIDHNFLTIDDQQALSQTLLNDSQLKMYQQQSQQSVNINPPLPPLTPIKRLNSPRKILNTTASTLSKNDYNIASINNFKSNSQEAPTTEIEFKHRPLAKKSLPHKKRITKKLKIIERHEQPIEAPPLLFTEEPEEIVEDESITLPQLPQFSCQLCGNVSESQLDFFAHLKQHYEPINSCDDKNDITIKIEDKKDTIVEADLRDVELNFDDFDGDTLNQEEKIMTENEQHDEQKSIPVNNVENVPSPKNINEEIIINEVEFSDTEDMLEGIRGVVDKVQQSVDDTNDDMDIISEKTWYSNSALNGDLNFKTGHTSSHNQQPADIFPLFFRGELDKQIIHHEDILPPPSELDLSDLSSHSEKKQKRRGRRKADKSTSKKPNAKAINNNPDDSDDEVSSDQEKLKVKKRVQCPKCDKIFNSINALKYHDLSHTGQRPHQCEVCGKSFFALSALKVHMRLHSGDKPYECEICKRAFRQWGDLKYHTISIHTNEKNFQCEFCGKAFARRYSLVVHRRIHTCERNYKCEFCQKTFRASSYLQNHRKVHTGEKPYACKVCGKKFRVSGDLKRHTLIHNREKRKSKQSSGSKKKDSSNKNSKIEESQIIKEKDIKNEIRETDEIKLNTSKESEPLFYNEESLDIFKTEPSFGHDTSDLHETLANSTSSSTDISKKDKQNYKLETPDDLEIKPEINKSVPMRPEESESISSVDLGKLLSKGNNFVYFW